MCHAGTFSPVISEEKAIQFTLLAMENCQILRFSGVNRTASLTGFHMGLSHQNWEIFVWLTHVHKEQLHEFTGLLVLV